MNFDDIKKFFFKKPKIELENSEEVELKNEKGEIPAKVVLKCEKCKQIIISSEFIAQNNVCPKCGHYHKIGARQRILSFADPDSFVETDKDLTSENILDFPGYDQKLETARAESGESEGVVCGVATVQGIKTAVFAMDYRFMMCSMGHAVGEKITRLFEKATGEGLPVVGFALSGGARMQEGIVSLMQMAKTSGAVGRHGEAGLLFISVLCDPTSGGVSASFAFEGDIILAEKGALICFAGPRVIEQPIRQKLPQGFQRAEFLLKKGFVDAVYPRNELKDVIGKLLKLHRAEVEG